MDNLERADPAERWVDAREAAPLLGMGHHGSLSHFALDHGVPYVKRGKKHLYPLAELMKAHALVSRSNVPDYPDFNQEWRHDCNMVLIGDAHCPLDWVEGREHVLRVRDEHKITDLGIVGDLLNCSQFGKFHDRYPIPWQHEKAAARNLLYWASKEFERVWVVTGNHEMRYIRKLERGDPDDVWELEISPLAPEAKRRLAFSTYGFFICQGVRVTHPYIGRMNAVSWALAQANIHTDQSILAFHHHTRGKQDTLDGRRQAAACGMFSWPEKHGYKYLSDGIPFPLWTTGFAAIVDGRILLYDERGMRW